MTIVKFGYKDGPSSAKVPIWSKRDENIIGLELEYNNTIVEDCDYCDCDDCDYCDDYGNRYTKPEVVKAFDNLFDKGIIINPQNTSMIQKDHNAVLERDGSVDGEIILQADYERNIMNKINKINKELNSSVLNNGRNTSCHIHRNVKYLNNIGSSKFDYQKASEFLAGVLYRISGRDKVSYKRWCKSVFNKNINITSVSMLKMAQFVDNMDSWYSGKYLLCNCEHSETVESRIFSNYHNFDPKYIKLFIDFTNLTIDLSKYMKNKSYVEEFDTLIDWINDFCNKNHRRRRILRPYNLDQYIVKKEDIRYVDFNGRWTEIYENIEDIAKMSYLSYNEQIKSMIRIFRNNNINLNATITTYDRINFDDIISALNVEYSNQLREL